MVKVLSKSKIFIANCILIIVLCTLMFSYSYQKSKLLVLENINETAPYHTIHSIKGKPTGFDGFEIVVDFAYLTNSGNMTIESVFVLKNTEIVDAYRRDNKLVKKNQPEKISAFGSQ